MLVVVVVVVVHTWVLINTTRRELSEISEFGSMVDQCELLSECWGSYGFS